MKTYIKFIVLFVFLFCGCETLWNLNSLSSNRSGLEQYVQKQENYYNKLKSDYLGGSLKSGWTKDQVISKYGEPIFCYGDKQPDIKEYCSFRHPTKYFESDIINLKFNKENKLVSWELKPASQK